VSVKNFLKLRAKMALAPLIYKYYPIRLQPSRLYLWLDALYKTRSLRGAVVEVGIAAGGTSALSFKMLRQIRSMREYVCIDTFSGFPKEQFEEDVRLGNSWKHSGDFSDSSIELVQRVLELHGASDIRLIKGDISKIDPAKLPSSVSACLLDVDLAVPIYDGLKLIWPLLESGGVVVVDDCYENNVDEWQALKGYRKFCSEAGLNEHFFGGAGYLVKGNQTADGFPAGSPEAL
jgi:O-methyltransferase